MSELMHRFNVDLLRLRQELIEFYTTEDIEKWLFAKHKSLNGVSPIDLLGTSRANEVFALIDQLRSGAYV